MDNTVELVITVVVVVDDEQAARGACAELVFRISGQIVDITDCSAEEPGCWAVTISLASDERPTTNLAGALARAVRQFVRELTPGLPMPRVACEPPTAWTVLDDPDIIGALVPDAERLLIEAWHGDNPYRLGLHEPAAPEVAAPKPRAPAAEPPARVPAAEPPARVPEQRPPSTNRTSQRGSAAGGRPGGHRLTLRVDVAAARAAGAEWQARAVASRISPTVTLTQVTEGPGVVSVHVDLGPAASTPPQTVLAAVSALDRPGWSPLSWDGDTAVTRWVASPQPDAGITAMELSSGPDPASPKRKRRSRN
jgi:hypothetical protein